MIAKKASPTGKLISIAISVNALITTERTVPNANKKAKKGAIETDRYACLFKYFNNLNSKNLSPVALKDRRTKL